MPVYASTACLRGELPLPRVLDAYESAGVDAVELGASRLDGAAPLVDELRRRPLTYAIHNYFPPPADPFVLNLASADADLAARSAGFVGSSLELASAIDAPFYAVHGGFAVDPVEAAGGLSFPAAPPPRELGDAARRYEERIGPLAARARELGVSLLVENNVCTPAHRGKLLHQTAEELRELVAAVPGLGLLVDTGHLNVTATTLGFDRVEFVRSLAPLIGAFHVHDNDGRVDRHRPVEGGSWVLPLVAAVQAPLVVEARFDEPAALAAHVRWLAREVRR